MMSVRRQQRAGPNGTVREFWIVDIEYRHSDGRKERVRKVPRRQTRVAAEALEREILDELKAGTYGKATTEVPTLSQFAGEFLENYAKTNNKPSELQAKRMILRRHLIPAFGERKLDTLGAREFEKYKADKLRDKYSPKTINNQLTVLGTVLRTATSWGIIAASPRIKQLKVAVPEIEFLDFDEADRLMNVTDGQWRAMIILALNTGLRLGELIALRWDSTDLVAGRLTVKHNWWRGIIGTPKGGRSREIPLNEIVIAALKQHRHLRGPFVFCRENGVNLTDGMCQKPLRRLCLLAGVKDVQWHGLRHTFGSHLVMKGVPLRAVQLLLGHATIAMTERYAHLTPDVRKDAVRVLERQPDGNVVGVGKKCEVK